MRRQQGIKITKGIHDTILSIEFLNQFRLSERYFTRKRKLTFVNLVVFILNFLSKSTQAELNQFFDFMTIKERISQQAFSKARQKISPEAFKYLYELTVIGVREDEESMRGNGYRLFAIDSTEVHLEPTKELIEVYGQKKHNQNCKARVSILCDVNEGMIIDAQMDSYAVGERVLAKRHLEVFEAYKRKKDLIIFDRGYPSKELIAMLSEKKIKFLMRVQKSFSQLIDESTQEDYYMDLSYQKKTYKVRIIKLKLPSNEIEVLVTNVGRNQFKKSEFMELYFKRWPIETKYNTIKNKLKLENFSGRTLISVQQDFYATMFLSNLVAISKVIADESIREMNREKDLKYNYQVNESMLIGHLKNRLVKCLLEKNDSKREQLLNEIIEDAIHSRVPIRPGRSFKRKNIDKKKRSIKRPLKSNL